MTSPSTMSGVCDIIGNQIPTNATKWNFEIKLFRENPHSLDPAMQQAVQQQQVSANFLHTLTFSTNPKEIICLVKGVGTSFKGPFDQMLATKLQSLWQLRQTVRGEGTAFEMNGGEYWIRLGNMMLQGNFRGLIIEVEFPNKTSFFDNNDADGKKQESTSPAPNTEPKLDDVYSSETYQQIREIINKLTTGASPLKDSSGRIIVGPLHQIAKKSGTFSRVETSWQYIEALENR